MKAADALLYEKQQEAAGNVVLAKSVTPELTEYNRVERWSGNYPNVMAGESTELLIDSRNK